MSTFYPSNLYLFCIIASFLALLEIVFYFSTIFRNIFVFQCKLLSLLGTVSTNLFLFNVFMYAYLISNRSANQGSYN